MSGEVPNVRVQQPIVVNATRIGKGNIVGPDPDGTYSAISLSPKQIRAHFKGMGEVTDLTRTKDGRYTFQLDTSRVLTYSKLKAAIDAAKPDPMGEAIARAYDTVMGTKTAKPGTGRVNTTK